VWYGSNLVGNNLHSIGGTLSVLGPIRDHFTNEYFLVRSEAQLKELDSKHISAYVLWFIDSFRNISLWQQDFVIWLVEAYYKDKRFYLRKHNLKGDMAYDPSAYFLPLFAVTPSRGDIPLQ
jgi:hypothetical protein